MRLGYTVVGLGYEAWVPKSHEAALKYPPAPCGQPLTDPGAPSAPLSKRVDKTRLAIRKISKVTKVCV